MPYLQPWPAGEMQLEEWGLISDGGGVSLLFKPQRHNEIPTTLASGQIGGNGSLHNPAVTFVAQFPFIKETGGQTYLC